MTQIGINGFGRIGRIFLRIAIEENVEVLAINHPSGTLKKMAYMLKHDSTHGIFPRQICIDDKHLIVDKRKIKIFHEKDPQKIPWKDAGVKYVLESSGLYTTIEKGTKLLTPGVNKILISAPSKDAPMYVYGVNICEYKPEHKVVSMASCTTNGLAPIAKVLHDKYCIKEGLMTTVHAVTMSQRILDGSSKKVLRDGRSGFQNIIPVSTGAAKAVAKVIPSLKGKLTGMAFRVPVADVSVVDLTVSLEKPAKMDAIKQTLREASECSLRGILGYTEEEVASSDFIGSRLSTVFDANASLALNDNFVKIISWYDNEAGYAHRLVDTLKFMQQKDAEASSQDCGDKKS